MSPLSPNTKLRVRRPDGIFPRASCQSTLYLGIGGKSHVIVGKNKMCLRYSMYRTSSVLKTKTRQIGSDKSKRRTTEQYTQTLKVECVRMHLDMGGMVCGVDSAPQAFFPYLKATLDRKHTHTHTHSHTHIVRTEKQHRCKGNAGVIHNGTSNKPMICTSVALILIRKNV